MQYDFYRAHTPYSYTKKIMGKQGDQFVNKTNRNYQTNPLRKTTSGESGTACTTECTYSVPTVIYSRSNYS